MKPTTWLGLWATCACAGWGDAGDHVDDPDLAAPPVAPGSETRPGDVAMSIDPSASSVPPTVPDAGIDPTCHASDEEASAREICRGGSGLDLQGAIYPFAEPATFVTRNGNAFLAIDGSCRYWVRPSQRLRETRTGSLSSDEAARIVADLRMAEWSGWYDRLGPLAISDGSLTILWDSTSGFGCRANCSPDSTPLPGYECMIADWSPLFQAFTAWLDALYDRGSPVSGAMRVRGWPFLGDLSKEDPMTFYEWPAATPLDQVISADQASAPATGTLITGPDADALRALRDRARDYYYAPGSTVFQSWIIITTEETAYFMELDDALPIEGADGIIPRPALELAPPGDSPP